MKDVVLLLTKLESLTITSCRMEQEQADGIFQRLKEGTSLKEICIINPVIKSTVGMVGLSKVSAEVLGGGLCRIRIVKLHRVDLTTEQKQSLMKNIERKGQNKILELSTSKYLKD